MTRPAPANSETRLITRVLYAINRILSRAYHRLEVYAPCRLPAKGAAIIVCNHTSGLDPHLIQSCCPRLIVWMMAKEWYELPVLNPILKAINIIPVTRSGRDTTATRAAMRALRDGMLLGIFPEGKIENSRELMPFQTGAALMAMKMGVPVYPAYLDGSQRNTTMLQGFLMPHQASIIFGDEVVFDRSDDSRQGQEAATAAIQAAVTSLQRRMDNLRINRDL